MEGREHRRTAGRAGGLRPLGDAVDVDDRRLVGRILVAGQKDVAPARRAIVDLLDDLLGVFDRV